MKKILLLLGFILVGCSSSITNNDKQEGIVFYDIDTMDQLDYNDTYSFEEANTYIHRPEFHSENSCFDLEIPTVNEETEIRYAFINMEEYEYTRDDVTERFEIKLLVGLAYIDGFNEPSYLYSINGLILESGDTSFHGDIEVIQESNRSIYVYFHGSLLYNTSVDWKYNKEVRMYEEDNLLNPVQVHHDFDLRNSTSNFQDFKEISEACRYSSSKFSYFEPEIHDISTLSSFALEDTYPYSSVYGYLHKGSNFYNFIELDNYTDIKEKVYRYAYFKLKEYRYLENGNTYTLQLIPLIALEYDDQTVSNIASIQGLRIRASINGKPALLNGKVQIESDGKNINIVLYGDLYESANISNHEFFVEEMDSNKQGWILTSLVKTDLYGNTILIDEVQEIPCLK